MRWLTPEESSDHLWDKYRVKRNTRRLAQLRAAGEGPQYFRDGNVVRYRDDLLDAWAEQQLGEPLSSTSEESGRRLPATATAQACLVPGSRLTAAEEPSVRPPPICPA